MAANRGRNRGHALKATACVAGALVLLAPRLVPLEAGMDLSKVLVGQWEGEMHAGVRCRDRYPMKLVIESIRQQGEKWIADRAKWGAVGQDARPIKVTLEVTDGDVFVRFVTPRNTSVDLKLDKGKSLLGSAKLDMDCPVRLEKVK